MAYLIRGKHYHNASSFLQLYLLLLQNITEAVRPETDK